MQVAVERQQLAQSQQVFENQKSWAREVQAIVQRQIAIKQKELREADSMLLPEREFVKSQSLESERRFNEFFADAKRHAAAQHDRNEKEKRMRIDAQNQLLSAKAENERLRKSMRQHRQKPSVYRLDMNGQADHDRDSSERLRGAAAVTPSVIAIDHAQRFAGQSSGNVVWTSSVTANAHVPVREESMVRVTEFPMGGQLSSGTAAVTPLACSQSAAYTHSMPSHSSSDSVELRHCLVLDHVYTMVVTALKTMVPLVVQQIIRRDALEQ